MGCLCSASTRIKFNYLKIASCGTDSQRFYNIFSAAKAAQGVQMSVRQDTLTLTAYKSLCRCRTYKCEVSLELFTQGLLKGVTI